MTEDEIHDLKPGDVLRWFEEHDIGNIDTYLMVVGKCTKSGLSGQELQMVAFKTLIDLSTDMYQDKDNWFEVGYEFMIEQERVMRGCTLVSGMPND